MQLRLNFHRALKFGLIVTFALAAPIHLYAQDEDNPTPEKHGRKYKAPPATSHIEVTRVEGLQQEADRRGRMSSFIQ